MSISKFRFPLFAAVFCAALVALIPLGCNSTSSDDKGNDTTCTGSACGHDTLPDTLSTGALDTTYNGILVTVGGHTWALADADVYRYSATNHRELNAENVATSAFTHDAHLFRGATLNAATVSISNTVATDSLQTCGSGAANASFKIEFSSAGDSGGVYTATSCTIKVTYQSQNGGLAGTVLSATLSNGTKTFNVTNARFRVYRQKGTVGTVPDVTPTSAFHAALGIDSGTFELPTAQYFTMAKLISGVSSGIGFGLNPNDGTPAIDGNASASVSLRFPGAPNKAGTWICGQSQNGATPDIQVWLGTYQSEMSYQRSAASCTLLVVGQTNQALLATFRGTLVAADNILPLAKRTIRVHGSYRNYSLGAPLPLASETLLSPTDTTGADLTVGTNGSYHFPAGGKYRGVPAGIASKTASNFGFNAGFKHLTGTRNDFTLNFGYVPLAVGNYTCNGSVPGATTYKTQMTIVTADTSGYVGIRYAGYGNSDAPGSSCNITVATSTAKLITGTYSANLVADGAKNLLPDGDTTLTVSGNFRVNLP